MCVGSAPKAPKPAPVRAASRAPTLVGVARRVTDRISEQAAFRSRLSEPTRADGSSLGLARLGATAQNGGFTGPVVLGQTA